MDNLKLQQQIDELKLLVQSSVERPNQVTFLDPISDAIIKRKIEQYAVGFAIGGIYISVDPANPVLLLGYGTWTAFGVGRTLVGVDTGQVEFDTVEETGGSKTHTLSISEMPNHNHPADDYSNGVYFSGGSTTTNTPSPSSSTNNVKGIAPQGGGVAHNNLQPYITCYFWKRTA